MNAPNWIKNLYIPRLLAETILIFASVYLALLLEADRNRDFEREVLIGELGVLLNELKSDSIKISSLVNQQVPSEEWEMDYFLRDLIRSDSIAIAKILGPNPPFGIISDKNTLVCWEDEWLRISSTHNSVISEFRFPILEEENFAEIEKYKAMKEDFIVPNTYLKTRWEDALEYHMTEYSYLLDSANFDREFEKKPLFQNLLMISIRDKKKLIPKAYYFLEYSHRIRKALEDEIEIQSNAMGGIF